MRQVLLGFIKKEFLQSLRDPRMRIVLFVMPVMQMVMFGLAISTEINNIRLAARFEPSDSLSRKVFERSLASGWFVPATTAGEDPFKWVQSGAADAVLVAPAGGLERSLARGEGELQLLVNASNVLRAQAVERYIGAIVWQATSEFLGSEAPIPPLTISARVLYNPAMESAVFMVPGVMSMILCVVTILLTSMSIAREREIGTMETILSAPVKGWQILLGKTIPFVVLGMIDIPLILGAAVLLFGVPVRGGLWEVALAGFLFVCTTVCIGTLISTFSSNQQQAMMGGFIFLFAANLLSGIMFPVENMPALMLVVAELNPLKHFVVLFRNVLLKGGDPTVLWKHVGILAVMCLFSAVAAFRRFRTTLQ